ncbi:uncharacterized protein A4U43_C07F6200 [Asparagus officinalis]|uniref:Serine-threonine/tyrosine-protein kinase catalytic domain-containing protein n=1 Tax=Asparagus officinalis TaxID=4686 RepID=A0A5P1EA57_ASPOF|nr:uncharacterized protein A4U43_C07F6200 [Asparagus officinalis]
MRSSQDFHPDYIVVAGSSRNGTAYHVVLRDGSTLTVKRLYGCLLLEKQFRAEMGRMGQIRHPNLVTLLGYCVVEEEKILIYKHITNGALSSMIRNGCQGLDWPTRLRIGVGEYATNPVPSTKGDVYGFGVVLLELATGQKAPR